MAHAHRDPGNGHRVRSRFICVRVVRRWTRIRTLQRLVGHVVPGHPLVPRGRTDGPLPHLAPGAESFGRAGGPLSGGKRAHAGGLRACRARDHIRFKRNLRGPRTRSRQKRAPARKKYRFRTPDRAKGSLPMVGRTGCGGTRLPRATAPGAHSTPRRGSRPSLPDSGRRSGEPVLDFRGPR